jgi:hypothetical protein
MRRHMRYVLLSQVERCFDRQWCTSEMGTPLLMTLTSLDLVDDRDLLNWAKLVYIRIDCYPCGI